MCGSKCSCIFEHMSVSRLMLMCFRRFVCVCVLEGGCVSVCVLICV